MRAIFDHNSKICYLRTHGNQDMPPVTQGVWDSAHLIEDGPPPPVVPQDTPKVPESCPASDGKILRVAGIEYQLYCTKGYSIDIPNAKATKATDVYDCLAQCGMSCLSIIIDFPSHRGIFANHFRHLRSGAAVSRL